MTTAKELLENLISWGKRDDDIACMILEGSRAASKAKDSLSDYDINIFVKRRDKYLVSDDWMSEIGDVLFYKKDAFPFYDETVIMRLAIFQNRERIDFSFWNESILPDLATGKKTYESYNNGFQVLLDKTGFTDKFTPPTGNGFNVKKPTKEQFATTVYEFWFEIYSVIRSLARNDLWYARLIENRSLKDYFYQMLIWNHMGYRKWENDPKVHLWGKNISTWIPEEMKNKIEIFFSGSDREAFLANTLAIARLFSKLAKNVADELSFPHLVEKEALFFDYLESIRTEYFQVPQDFADGII